MTYTEVVFQIEPLIPGAEIAMAQLAEIGYESFEETDTGVKAFIPTDQWDEEQLKGIQILNEGFFLISYSSRNIEEQNWNQVWESNYDPVTIAGRVTIRASFHEPDPNVDYELLIDPKMSFGTAHHETTAQIISQLLEENLVDKTLLDMGAGTAVLAILAQRLGARKVVAIDNDPNAVENARENVLKNKCHKIDVHLGTAETIKGQFDVILANINKNILLADMSTYEHRMNPGGVILLSGFYKDDLEDLIHAARKYGLDFDSSTELNAWVMARFIKQ